MVILKEVFEKVNFENKSADAKKAHAHLSGCLILTGLKIGVHNLKISFS